MQKTEEKKLLVLYIPLFLAYLFSLFMQLFRVIQHM